MAGGIEERILDNIESATGTAFDEGGDDSPQQEPGQPNVPVDEQAQVAGQLNRRQQDDENLMQPTKPAPAKGKDQRKGPDRKSVV